MSSNIDQGRVNEFLSPRSEDNVFPVETSDGNVLGTLMDMFPNLHVETLLGILRINNGNFEAAVEEALAADDGQMSPAQTTPATLPTTREQQWWSGPPLQQHRHPVMPPPHSMLEAGLSSVSHESDSDSLEESLPPTTPRTVPLSLASTAHSARRARSRPRAGPEQTLVMGSPPQYIIDTGELDLLSKLRTPGRGSRLTLSPDFLRLMEETHPTQDVSKGVWGGTSASTG
ncbi:unnamed protein product, partial [Discosporangium mesarthrocarpum]